MRRMQRPRGILEIDAPSVACFRNRLRLLRGKHITYDYADYYLRATPILYQRRLFYPVRHNRKFTCEDLDLPLKMAGFEKRDTAFLKSGRYREGLQTVRSFDTAVKDLMPSLRKSLLAVAYT